jgi:hypothetical protein
MFVMRRFERASNTFTSEELICGQNVIMNNRKKVPRFLVQEIASSPPAVYQQQQQQHLSSGKLLSTSTNKNTNSNTMSYVRNENSAQSPYEAIPSSKSYQTNYENYNGTHATGSINTINMSSNNNYNNQPTLELLAKMNNNNNNRNSFPPAPKVAPPLPPDSYNNQSMHHSPHYLTDKKVTTELKKQSPSHFHAEEHHSNHAHHLTDKQVKENVSYYEDVRKNHMHSSRNHEDTIAGGWMEVLQNGLKIPENHDAVEASRIRHQRERLKATGKNNNDNHRNKRDLQQQKFHSGSPSLPFYENTNDKGGPAIPYEFIDSHRVKKKHMQQQLLTEHVKSQQQRPREEREPIPQNKTNLYKSMEPTQNFNDDDVPTRTRRFSAYNTFMPPLPTLMDNSHSSDVNYNKTSGTTKQQYPQHYDQQQADTSQMTMDFINELKEKHKLQEKILHKELADEKQQHLECKESLKVSEDKNRQYLEGKALHEKTRDEHLKRIEQLEGGLNDAMTRWKQSTTLAVSSINSLKLSVSHANVNNSTLVKYILELEQCVTKQQYDTGVSMERPNKLIKEPLVLAADLGNNNISRNPLTPEQLRTHPVVLNAIDKAKAMTEEMISGAMKEALNRSESPHTVNQSDQNNVSKLYPGMSDPVEAYNKSSINNNFENSTNHNNDNSHNDSAAVTNDSTGEGLHTGIYEKVINSPFKGTNPPKALIDDRTTMLNILFDDSSHLQTRERVAKAIAHPFNGRSQIPLDVKDDRTATLELLFNL